MEADWSPIYKRHQQLQQYTSHLTEILNGVTGSQLCQLQHKYRHQLQDYHRMQAQFQQLYPIWSNLSRHIDMSPPVCQLIKSITFIAFISSTTKVKLQQLVARVENYRSIKNNLEGNVAALRQDLFSKNRYFFELKRKQQDLTQKLNQAERMNKQKEIRNTMKNVMRQNIRDSTPIVQKQKLEASPLKQIQTLATKQNNPNTDLIQKIEDVDELKQEFLSQLKLTQRSIFSFRSKKYERQTFLNKKLKSKPSEHTSSDRQPFREMSIKSSQPSFFSFYKKGRTKETLMTDYSNTHTDDLKDLKFVDELRNKFRDLPPEEVLNLVVNNDKVDELYSIMENEKQPLVNVAIHNKKANKGLTLKVNIPR